MGKKINWWTYPGTSEGERLRDWRRRNKAKRTAKRSSGSSKPSTAYASSGKKKKTGWA